MNKPIKNILCYSHYDFDKIMENNKWKENHPNIEGQYVILHYTTYYTSRICMIFEGTTITWID